MTDSHVDKYIREISRRLVITVTLGCMTKIDKGLLNDCRDVFQLRNYIAHGERTRVSREEAGRKQANPLIVPSALPKR